MTLYDHELVKNAITFFLGIHTNLYETSIQLQFSGTLSVGSLRV